MVVVLGLALGFISGFAGVALEHHLESTHGAAQSPGRHGLELLILPALPGMIIAQRRFGPDWQIDEAWFFRLEISGWNALVWALAAAALTPLVAWRMATSQQGKRGAKR